MKYVAILNGKKYEVELEKIEEYMPLSREAAVVPAGQAAPIAPMPKQVPIENVAPVSMPKAPAPGGDNRVLSPMPGNIWDIKVSEGQSVKAGQTLIVLEAMKMENDIVAPVDGIVSSINVKKGDIVESETILAILG